MKKMQYIPFEDWNKISVLKIFDLMLHHKNVGIHQKNDCNIYSYIAAIALLTYKKNQQITKDISKKLNEMLNDFLKHVECEENIIKEKIYIQKHKDNIFSNNFLNAVSKDNYVYMFNLIKCTNKEHCLKKGIELINNVLLKEGNA